MNATTEIQSLLRNHHHDWKVREVEDWSEITTTHLDRHNDMLQIYARRDEAGSGFLISDDSYTVRDLATSGRAQNMDQLFEIFALLGVELNDEAIEIRASNQREFVKRAEGLVRAMLIINERGAKTK